MSAAPGAASADAAAASQPSSSAQQQQQQPHAAQAAQASEEAAAAQAAEWPSQQRQPTQQPQPSQPPQQHRQQRQQQFSVGEAVCVRRYGSAVVVSAGPVAEPDNPHAGRVQVVYPNGSTYWARPSSLTKVEQPPARVLVTETTDHYRAAAQAFTHPNDIVLEVGSSHGVTCEMLHQRCKLVVGVDSCAELVAESRLRYPHLRFEVADGLNVGALKALSPTGSFTKVFIDIGGTAELSAVTRMVGLYFKAFPRDTTLIVKSKYLRTLLGNARVWLPEREAQERAAKQARQAKQQVVKQQQQQEAKQQAKQQPPPPSA